MSSKAQRRGSDYRRKRKRFHVNHYTRKVSDTLELDCISASAKKLCKENYLDKERSQMSRATASGLKVYSEKNTNDLNNHTSKFEGESNDQQMYYAAWLKSE
ncbi:hypothetical protein TNCV_2560171 [Trichonephila clavipes]|uniref:Uncharacterized protein n=1 Tax=Trichonephila clavipes TaxID=2585209 RepID=A0A8X6R106_TRICX|nr:hypothetical protein TNCV_2560171 [Trichonephila clavipes]